MLDFIRIGCAVPNVQVGDPIKNAEEICAWLDRAEEKKCDLVIFPELAVTGYTCGDLFFQDILRTAAKQALKAIAAYTEKLPALTVVVGAPLQLGGGLFNCGVVISGGSIRGVVPKTFLCNEMDEGRWFVPGSVLKDSSVNLGYDVPMGTDLLFALADGTQFGVEICEDLWRPVSPSVGLAHAGAEVIVNLSASNETVGKRSVRRDLVRSQSRMTRCTYAYVSSGYTESTQDTVFSGHSLVAERGALLKESEGMLSSNYLLVTDSDLGKSRVDRIKKGFVGAPTDHFRVIPCGNAPRSDGAYYNVSKNPFMPVKGQAAVDRCKEVFAIQARSLAQRLRLTGGKAVIGVSGGLDSTLALLVAVEAMRLNGKEASDVHGITMPCFGTTDRTYQNALSLMAALGITAKEIPIRDAVSVHFRDIGQDPERTDVTYENAQARERTQVLMDYAGLCGGIVVGTGDLSELALGWCTYNGDHMSMYGVNASVPKTLIREMIGVLAEEEIFASSIITKLCFLAISLIAFMSQGRPAKCTGIIALVLGVIFALILMFSCFTYNKYINSI